MKSKEKKIKKGKNTRKAVLICLLCIACTAFVAGICTVIYAFAGDRFGGEDSYSSEREWTDNY